MKNFLRWMHLVVLGLAAFAGCLLAQQAAGPSLFLFGTTAYPDLVTRRQWNQILDEFAGAHFNIVRVGESSWGNLETAPGHFAFGWLRDALDDLERRHMKAILGTSSYNPPQWLVAKNPEMLVQLQPGARVHPMGRKSPSLTHPAYREAVRRYVRALAAAFQDHPAVLAWQLDNETDILMDQIDYSEASERAWREWLTRAYRTPQELNRRLFLQSWGQNVDSLDEIPQPRATAEGHGLPALMLAHYRFRRDTMMDFFNEQARILRQAGVKQWILTDTTPRWLSFSDDPAARRSMDIAGFNMYQPNPEPARYFMDIAWHFDKERSSHRLNRFLTTETRFGVIGDTVSWDPAPSREQFRLWMFQPVAFGSVSLMFWSGNRWRGGPWPQFGGVLDWTGQPEPDVAWLQELGAFFGKWGARLVDSPVRATAAVLTDFDQRAALQVYRHVPSSQTILPEAFEALHRLGIGADSISGEDASRLDRMSQYSLIVIPAATALDGPVIPAALQAYVEQGGNLLVTPFTAYQSRDGVFREDGFGANLARLTGAVVRTGRRMGAGPRVSWSLPGMRESPAVGVDGYCEIMDVKDAEIVATFQSEEPILNGRPAAIRKRHGKGTVIQVAFWSGDDSFLRLFGQLVPASGAFPGLLPAGLQAVPRADGSLFLLNTTRQARNVELLHMFHDRISGRTLSGAIEMKPYEAWWLARE